MSHYKQFMALIDSNQHKIRTCGSANLISSAPVSQSHIEAVIWMICPALLSDSFFTVVFMSQFLLQGTPYACQACKLL